MKVHVTGTVAGQPVDESFTPIAGFQLQPLELTPSGQPATRRRHHGEHHSLVGDRLRPDRQGTVTIVSSVPNTRRLAGHVVRYSTITWLALIGAIAAGAWRLSWPCCCKRNSAFDEAARIRARYSHLLVPIVVGEDLGWPPVDVTSFKALARLAESSGQLVLHHQADAVDTYLVNDNGTVYRYQISAAAGQLGRVDRHARRGSRRARRRGQRPGRGRRGRQRR